MKLILSIILLCFFQLLNAQRLVVEIYGVSGIDLDHPKYINDSIEGELMANNLVSQLHSSAFMEAMIDSTVLIGRRFQIYLDQGKEYKWVHLRAGNLNDFEVSQIDMNGRLFMNRSFNAKQLRKLYQRSIQYFEDHGYPFASVKLDSIVIDSSKQISAALSVDRGKIYKIDSVNIKSEERMNKAYLKAYLNIKEGSLYNERRIKEISTRMQEVPFLEEARDHEVRFFEKGVNILIYPKKKKASRFDGILGLLTEEETGKIEFTGDVDLLLINSFNRGERIGFNWRKLKGNSQDLQLDLSYPYIFQTQFGVDYYFKLFRRDTTFLDLTNRIGVSYAKSATEQIKIFAERKTSSLLSRNNLNSSGISDLALGDVKINLFGLGYSFQNYNYIYNPRRGIGIELDGAFGQKRLEKINALLEENPNLYDGVKLTTTQYSGNFNINYFIPIGGRSTVLIANKSAGLYSENVYQNELLRFGGLKILRGFDEESLAASLYSFMTLEYRFILERNSYFSLFSDGGFYESETVAGYDKDTPIGIGAGINFETKAGIFSFNYAVGKQRNNPFDLRVAKIHFGFVNIF